MIILQIVYVILGILGLLSYLSTGKFLTLNLATMFLVGGTLSFLFATWWWLSTPVIDVFIVRPVVFLRQSKLLDDSNKKDNPEGPY